MSFSIIFPNSLIRANNRFVKNGTAKFGWNIPTEMCGPPPEMIPNIPVRRNRNGSFHFKLRPNDFRNLWHNESTYGKLCVAALIPNKYSELGHFTSSLFCRGRLRNLPSIITHPYSHCSCHKTLLFHVFFRSSEY